MVATLEITKAPLPLECEGVADVGTEDEVDEGDDEDEEGDSSNVEEATSSDLGQVFDRKTDTNYRSDVAQDKEDVGESIEGEDSGEDEGECVSDDLGGTTAAPGEDKKVQVTSVNPIIGSIDAKVSKVESNLENKRNLVTVLTKQGRVLEEPTVHIRHFKEIQAIENNEDKIVTTEVDPDW
ncbi:hypothetical protein U1Q18_022671 [Sarracenia purpurea var. burkii]